MKKLYWIIRACIDNIQSDLLAKWGGWGEYLADHQIGNEIDDCVHVLEGKPLVQLDKHLSK